MAQVISIRTAEDPRDVIHRLVHLLSDGALIAFPTETRYVVAAHSLLAESVKKLRECVAESQDSLPTLAIKSADEAFDYVPNMPSHGQRLARRCWPGPVILAFEPDFDRGLLSALPAETQNVILTEGRLALRVSSSTVLRAVMELLPAPLVLSSELAVTSNAETTADAIAAQLDGSITAVIADGPIRSEKTATVVQINSSDWRLVQEGAVAAQTITQSATEVVLFVCTGNTCRSPMAEALFRKFLADKLACGEAELQEHGFLVTSAGISAATRVPVSREAVQVLRDRGIDIESHTSRPVTVPLLQEADQIYTMTRNHRADILRIQPGLSDRVHVLARDDSDISDPFGRGMVEYKSCEREIERHVRDLVSNIATK